MNLSNSINGAFLRIAQRPDIFKPFVRVAVITSRGESLEVDAMMDSGSAYNFATMSVAAALLNRRPDEIRHKSPILISSVRKDDKAEQAPVHAWGWEVTLKLRGTSTSNSYTLIAGAHLYATDASVPYDLLLGQWTGLQGRAFIHLNYKDRRDKRVWTLRPGFPSLKAISGSVR